MRLFGLALLSLAVVGIATSSASATLFYVEPFNYADGQLTDSPDGTGDNVSGGLWVGHSGTTFDDNLFVVNDGLIVNASGSEDANRLTNVDMVAGNKWYAGFLFSITDTRADPNTESINNDYFAHFKDSTFGFRSRVYPDDPNVADPTTYTLGLSASSGGQTQKWATDYAFGSMHTAVVSYDFDSGASELWIDPVNMLSTKIEETTTVNPGTVINSFAFRQDFLSPGIPNNSVRIERLSVGDNFAQVLATAPEPTSLALLALGGVAVLRRRR